MNTALRFAALAVLAAGCQQKMAEQPSPRPYEEYAALPGKQSARTLSVGVVHRGQRPPDDPVISWLTPEGRKGRTGSFDGKDSYDLKSVVPPLGAPNSVENFVKEFPFPITADDLKRGQQRYNIYCGVCHGATGAGNGKIVERGYLRPPSYHVDPDGKQSDWASPGKGPDGADKPALPQGYSRGFDRFGVKVAIKDVPAGYIFQVVTWGFGGMPDLGWQVPAEDRWRIIAYIRALQLSQGASLDALPADAKKAAEAGLNGGTPGGH